MAMKLGGWQRLWIVIAVLYLFVVVWVAWSTLPSPSSLSHENALYSRLIPVARDRILNTQVKVENEQAFIQDARTATDAELVEMPNGHTLVFRKGLPRVDVEASTKAYWATVKHVANEKRITHVAQALVWWAIPLVFIYALGQAARWIYSGFK